VTTRVGSHTVIARFGARTRVTVGDVVALSFDSTHLHFFDADSGRNLLIADAPAAPPAARSAAPPEPVTTPVVAGSPINS